MTMRLLKPTWQELRKLRGVGNYQFGSKVGDILFRGRLQITHSKRTGKIRQIYRDGEMLGTLRPRDGYLALTINAAKTILRKCSRPPNLVVVRRDVEEFVASGRNVFARHVMRCDPAIRPMDEVIVVSDQGSLLAVGRAVLSGEEMTVFKRGVAVKVREGILRSHGKQNDYCPSIPTKIH
jgi:predicted RNA-binding protein (TIGR00451 family)